jgi:hypothetical protein
LTRIAAVATNPAIAAGTSIETAGDRHEQWHGCTDFHANDQ